MIIDMGLRGERWQMHDLSAGAEYASEAHNQYRRNSALEPLKRGKKSTSLPSADFQFARSFHMHDDKLVASDERIDWATTQVLGDKSRRLYFVDNGILQFLADNEVPTNYPTPIINGHRSGVPTPNNIAIGSYGEVGGFIAQSLIREEANAASNADGTLTTYELLPDNEKASYIETAFVFTYVNKYGEEGAPSLPTRAVMARPNSTRIIFSSIAQSTNPDVIGIRIYMLVNGDFYRIPTPELTKAETSNTAAIPNLTFTSSVSGGNLPALTVVFNPEGALDELQSHDWIQAPNGLKHMAALENGVLAVGDDHGFYLSVRYQWHAFPSAHYYQINGTMVRMMRINGGLAVLTDRGTQFFFGSSPDGMQEATVSSPYSIGDPDSLCIIDGGFGYVSRDGFVVVDNSGVSLITDGWIDRDQWESRIDVDECRCELHEGRVLIATRNPENGNPIGYCLNLAIQEATSFDIDERTLKAGFFRDPRNNEVCYVIDSVGLAVFNKGDKHVTLWESGDIIVPRFMVFNTVKVEAEAYPLDIIIKTPRQPDLRRTINSSRPVRIKPVGREGRFRLRIETGKAVVSCRIATDMRSL